jgi:hypothetical protein
MHALHIQYLTILWCAHQPGTSRLQCEISWHSPFRWSHTIEHSGLARRHLRTLLQIDYWDAQVRRRERGWCAHLTHDMRTRCAALRAQYHARPVWMSRAGLRTTHHTGGNHVRFARDLRGSSSMCLRCEQKYVTFGQNGILCMKDPEKQNVTRSWKIRTQISRSDTLPLHRVPLLSLAQDSWLMMNDADARRPASPRRYL